jgi:mono/diheme cytochrome c family protein
MRSAKNIFALGVISGVLVLLLVVSAYFVGGIAPVATASTPMPFEEFFAKAALHARLNRETLGTVPIPADEPNYQAGMKVYRENCAVCHGRPGQPLSAIAAGLFPKPPALFKGKGVTDDSPGETYWKVINGIRLTGMPGFRGSLSETQAWQVSLLLANADKLPPPVRSALSAPPEN